ncbi:SWI/SNF chromatin-remodeling complex subunit [Dimargaris xerosporica]|nr:SWI/SNF chromatin-remodeling complex subunit [Dimargaris xerosporica]
MALSSHGGNPSLTLGTSSQASLGMGSTALATPSQRRPDASLAGPAPTPRPPNYSQLPANWASQMQSMDPQQQRMLLANLFQQQQMQRLSQSVQQQQQQQFNQQLFYQQQQMQQRRQQQQQAQATGPPPRPLSLQSPHPPAMQRQISNTTRIQPRPSPLSSHAPSHITLPAQSTPSQSALLSALTPGTPTELVKSSHIPNPPSPAPATHNAKAPLTPGASMEALQADKTGRSRTPGLHTTLSLNGLTSSTSPSPKAKATRRKPSTARSQLGSPVPGLASGTLDTAGPAISSLHAKDALTPTEPKPALSAITKPMPLSLVNGAGQSVSAAQPMSSKDAEATTLGSATTSGELLLSPKRQKLYQTTVDGYRAAERQLVEQIKQDTQRMGQRLTRGRQETFVCKQKMGNYYLAPAREPIPTYEMLQARPASALRFVYGPQKRFERKVEVPRFSRDQLQQQAVAEEQLVPIRLEIETDGYKLRDTFTWNLNDSLISHEQFAETLCEDMALPAPVFVPAIVRQLREQLDDFRLHHYIEVAADHAATLLPPSPTSTIAAAGTANNNDDDEDDYVYDNATVQASLHSVADSTLASLSTSHDLRVVIRVDVTVGNVELMDQFEWDIGRSIIAEALKVRQATNTLKADCPDLATKASAAESASERLASATPIGNPRPCMDNASHATPGWCYFCGGVQRSDIPSPAKRLDSDPDLGFGLFRTEQPTKGPSCYRHPCVCRIMRAQQVHTNNATMLFSPKINARLWEIGLGCQDPEQFAMAFCIDLGLPGEFMTAIAHTIREQLFIYTKTLVLLSYPFDGSSFEDSDVQHALLPPLASALRPAHEVNEFTPSLVEISGVELERKEKDHDRDMRRKRRQTRGRRGIMLPDREPLKTTRTVWRLPHQVGGSKGGSGGHHAMGEDGAGLLDGHHHDALSSATSNMTVSSIMGLSQAAHLPTSLFAGHQMAEKAVVPTKAAAAGINAGVGNTDGAKGGAHLLTRTKSTPSATPRPPQLNNFNTAFSPVVKTEQPSPNAAPPALTAPAATTTPKVLCQECRKPISQFEQRHYPGKEPLSVCGSCAMLAQQRAYLSSAQSASSPMTAPSTTSAPAPGSTLTTPFVPRANPPTANNLPHTIPLPPPPVPQTLSLPSPTAATNNNAPASANPTTWSSTPTAPRPPLSDMSSVPDSSSLHES